MREKNIETNDKRIKIKAISSGGDVSELYEVTIFSNECKEVEIFFDGKEGINHETLLLILLDRLNGLSKKYDNNKKFNDFKTYSNAAFHLEEAIKELGHVKHCING